MVSLVLQTKIYPYISYTRIERIIFHAKKDYANFGKVEKNVNQLAAFYSQSHKRNNHFHDFLSESAKKDGLNEKPKTYKLTKIFPIRWVSSSFGSYEKVIKNFKPTIRHLREVQHPSGLLPDPKFDKKTKTKAKRHEKFLRDKYSLFTIMLLLDVLIILKKSP